VQRMQILIMEVMEEMEQNTVKIIKGIGVNREQTVTDELVHSL